MPELPEVETIVNGLKDLIEGHKIIDVIIRYKKIIGFPSIEEFNNKIVERNIKEVSRRGKYIVIELDQDYHLIIHLRMTGRLLVVNKNKEYDKHTHLIFQLDQGLDLRFNNVRKFGRAYLVKPEEMERAGSITSLGPEPLSADFTLADFIDRLQQRTTTIKALLLKQDFIAGIGNIYADEALFDASIAPDRKVNSLNQEEINRLYHSIRKVLKLGIKYSGTTISDYVNAWGETGGFQDKLNVYQQSGKKCPRCGHIIVKGKIGGRSSHFCSYCQK